MQLEHTTIPRKIIFGNPDVAGVKISPDGKNISWLAETESGVMNVFVAPSDNIANARPVTKVTGRGISNYVWAQDSGHILYLMDNDGDENTGLYVYDIESHQEVSKVVRGGVKVDLLAVSHYFPNTVLISTNERNASLFDIYTLNILTGEMSLLFLNEEGYVGFDVDQYLSVRFATRVDSDGSKVIDKIDSEGEVKEREYMVFKPDDADISGILSFDDSGDSIYVVDSGDYDTSAIFLQQINTKERKFVYSHEKTENISLILQPVTRVLQGVLHNYAKPKLEAMESEFGQSLAKLCAEVGPDCHIISRTSDDKFWIVATASDNKPAKYFYYDRNAGVASKLFSSNVKLEQYHLSKMYPVIVKARDGLEMLCYVTLPINVEVDVVQDSEDINCDKILSVSKQVPTVLSVHGGPAARDYWGFNSKHQWLANRGYAVISVNYRGSTGFGKDHLNKGNGEWGRKMHDDLIDVAQYARSLFATDVAIMGGSYGGYAALVGLSFTPEEFVCGIDIVGPSNLVTLFDSVPPYWLPLKASWKRKIGNDTDTEEGREFLLSRSPISKAENITKPLLIAQGANDPRVKKAESDQIVDVLRAHNIPVTYLLYPDEGHGFRRPQNSMSFYRIAEKFLASSFGTDIFESSIEGEEGSSMQIICGDEMVV